MPGPGRLVGAFAGVAAAVVAWTLVALAVGVVNESAREQDTEAVVEGRDTTLYERYDPYATHADVELWMAGLAAGLAFLLVPNRHWLPGWRVRAGLQALGAVATLALLFALFTDRAEYSASNLPFTLGWQVPVLALAAAGVVAQAWLTRARA